MPWKLLVRDNSTKEIIESHYLAPNGTYDIFNTAGVPRPVSGDASLRSIALARLTTQTWTVKLSAVESEVGIIPPKARSNPNADPPTESYKLKAETLAGSEIVFLRDGDLIIPSRSPSHHLELLWDDIEIQVSSSATDQTEIPESANAGISFESDEVFSNDHVSNDLAVIDSHVEVNNENIISTPRLSGHASVVTETPASNRLTTVQDVVRENTYGVPHSSNETATNVAPVGKFSTAPTAPDTVSEPPIVEGEVSIVTEEEIQERLVASQTTVLDLEHEETDSEETGASAAMSPELGDGIPSFGDDKRFHDEEDITDPNAAFDNAIIDEVIAAVPSLPDGSADHAPQFGGDDDETGDEVVEKVTVAHTVREKALGDTKVDQTAPRRTTRGKVTPHKTTTESTDDDQGLDFSAFSQSTRRRSIVQVQITMPAKAKRTSPVETPESSVRPAKRTRRVTDVSSDTEVRHKTPIRKSTRLTLAKVALLSSSDDNYEDDDDDDVDGDASEDDDVDGDVGEDDDGFDIAKPKVAFSNSAIPGTESFTKFLHSCGGRVMDNTSGRWDILCVRPGPIPKSPKLLISVAMGTPIVIDDWLKESARKRKFLPLKNYIPVTPEREKEWGFSMSAIWCQPQNELLKGKTVYFTPALSKAYHPFSDIQAVCKAAGAEQVKILRTPKDIKSDECLILAVEKDDEFASALNAEGHTCFHRDILPRSILRGHLDLKSPEFHIHPTRSQEEKNEDITGLRRRKRKS